MFALIYLCVVVLLGDAICRRFYPFASLAHRFAAAFLSGLLISTWWTYASAWLFSGFSSPMLWGNIVFFITAIGVILWLRQMPQKSEPQIATDLGKTEFERWDWVFIGLFFLFVCWQAFATFDMSDGKLQIAHHQWSDFGSNVSIMQSFALGSNFPTEYPHYSGEHIHYHFLFYFAAGNLEYLGFSPSLANNVLFILSTVSMLVLVMTLGVILFTSKVVGRIAAVIFFFHGSLSFIQFFMTNGLSNAWNAISNTRDFLPSGFSYRGELWGVWSQVVFINQRHLASSVGIFLTVLTFILLKNRERLFPSAALPASEPDAPPVGIESEKPIEEPVFETPPEAPQEEEPAVPKRRSAKKTKAKASESTDVGDVQKFVVKQASSKEDEAEPAPTKRSAKKPRASKNKPPKEVKEKVRKPRSDKPSRFAGLFAGKMDRLAPWIFSGILLGLMPMWNGAIFAAAAAVLAALLLLFPMRRELFVLGLVSGIVAIPQVIYLGTWDNNAGRTSPSLLHWGYTVDDPTILSVIWYLIFTFGFKWLLIVVALIASRGFQRKFFIAASALIAVAFCMQFSDEVLANHKFLNVWLILTNVLAAFGLWLIWNLAYLKNLFLGKIVAVILMFLITIGGVIDLFPIHNSFWMSMPFTDDRLVKWVTENTDPHAVFLSYHFVNSPILLAGRKLYFGHPYYAWSAGYPTFQRDAVYRKMFEETNPNELLRLLKENNISYVAIDNDVRSGDVTKNVNEAVYQAYFPKVFDDTESKYNNLKIYQITSALGSPNPAYPLPGTSPGEMTGVNAFTGGGGSGNGQFSKPRGIAVDNKGAIYIADQGNNRIQKFDAEGKFLNVFGTAGDGEGQFKEVNGVAADASGNVWVVDAGGDRSRLIKFTADGKFVKEWKGPADNNLFGPRDLAIGPNKIIYIVDQGKGRIVRFDPATEAFTEFGTLGPGDGQLHEATGICIAENSVVVADGGNNRIEVFDLNGKFVRQWNVPMWQSNVDPWHYPDVVYDDQAKKIYASSGWTSEVVAYDLEGNLAQGGFHPEEPNRLDNPSSLVISDVDKKRRLLVLNTGGNKVASFDLAPGSAKAASSAKPAK